MRVSKEIIRDTRVDKKITVQLMLDEDCNIPDSKPDVENIIRESGLVRADSIRINGNKAQIRGNLLYVYIYSGTDGRISKALRMEGELAFEENVNIPEVSDNTSVYCHPVLEDITVKTINSRKINIKAVITLELICEEDVESVVADKLETEEQENLLMTRSRRINYSCIAFNIKDNLRIRENIVLPSDKPPIGDIIWYDIALKSFNTRLTDEGVILSGEAHISLMYRSALEDGALEWYETVSPYEGKLEINGCQADMISFVNYNILGRNIEMKANEDGENTECLVELVLDLRIKAYEDKEKDILTDAYSPYVPVRVNKNEVKLKHLVLKSENECRAETVVKVADTDSIRKICSVTGSGQIDNITVTDKGLAIEGVVFADVFYIRNNNEPANVKAAVPFSTQAELETGENMEYDTQISAINLKCQVHGKNELVIRGNAGVMIICFENISVKTIDECECETDMEKFLNEPGLTGYIAQKDECMWNIAKKYHTTVDIIKSCNKNLPEKCDNEYVVPKGSRLLIMKAVKN